MEWTGSAEQWYGAVVVMAVVGYILWDMIRQAMFVRKGIEEVTDSISVSTDEVERTLDAITLRLAYERISQPEGTEESYVNAWYDLADGGNEYGRLLGGELRIIGNGEVTEPLHSVPPISWCEEHKMMGISDKECAYPYVRAHNLGKFGFRGFVVRKYRRECWMVTAYVVHREVMRNILKYETGDTGENLHTHSFSGS